MIVRSSKWPSHVLFVTKFTAALIEIFIAASISFDASLAVALAAAITVVTVPNLEEPLPDNEFTASLWAWSTNWVALFDKQES